MIYTHDEATRIVEERSKGDMKKNTLWVYAMLTALLLVLFGIPSALAAGTPTRTEKLDLTALTVPEDHLADEGWKWEPTQEGGILTLRNFYQKCQHNNSGMISVKGKITLVLEGENVLAGMDSLDLDILRELLRGARYFDMTESLHTTENTIKYRIKRMTAAMGLKSRAELLKLAGEYLAEEKNTNGTAL